MWYVVYHVWDSTGSSPTTVKNYATEDEVQGFLSDLERSRIRYGKKYEVHLIVKGAKYTLKQVSQFFLEEEVSE